jgi:hypothetical protein
MSEYKNKEGMIDNRMVKDNHQQGIERVKQRKGDTTNADKEGHKGKMGMNIPSESHWKRNDVLTPRKA